jgi:hypothetical protein
LDRPDGSQSTAIGWVFVIFGILSAVMAAIAKDMNWLIIWIALANLGVGLGVLLLSLGYLVRAIWFLPGREMDKGGHELQKCDYCDFKVVGPAQPCSAMPTAELKDAASRIDSDNCRRILAQKGFLPE